MGDINNRETTDENLRTPPRRSLKRRTYQGDWKERRRKRKGRNAFRLGLLLLTMAVLLIVIFVLAKEIKELRSKDQGEDLTPRYNQQEVDAMMAEAVESGKEEGRRELLESMKIDIEDPGQGVYDALRKAFKDYIFYYAGNQYYFVPVDESLSRNGINTDCITKSEDDILHYTVDGVEKGELMLDVSQFQGDVDWQAVAGYGIKKVMLRAGYRGYESGKLMEDEKFRQNIEGALEAGIEVGVYFFSQAISEAEGREEAAMVLDLIAPYQVTLPVAIDVEPLWKNKARGDSISREQRTAATLAFLQTVEAAGYQPMIYGALYGIFEMLDFDRIKHYPIWFAFYEDYPYYPYTLQAWQYSEGGGIPGIGTTVDLNLWFTE